MAHKWAYKDYNWKDLTPSNRAIFEQIELLILPLRSNINLLEAELNNSQISKIFTTAEELGKQQNIKTGFGKLVSFPAETNAKINKILTSFGSRLQQSTPVAKVDEKFEQLQIKIKNVLNKSNAGKKVLLIVDQLGQFAKDHPQWQSAIIGLLTAISGLTLGPASIPVVAALLRGAVELLKGEKLSTAVGKGVYAGVLGYVTASVASALIGYFESIRIESITSIGPSDVGIKVISFNGSSTNTVEGMRWTHWFKLDSATVDPTMRESITNAMRSLGRGDLQAYDQLLNYATEIQSPSYISRLQQLVTDAKISKVANDGFLQGIKSIGKYAVAASAGAATTLVPDKKGVKLPESLLEGLWNDLTLVFSASRLEKIWNKYGNPTDSVDIARILADLGMTVEDIEEVFKSANLADSDIKSTMRELMYGDSTDIPFISGIPDLDREAKIIFKTNGLDEFVKYWENKLVDLEKELEKTKPSSTSINSTSTSLPAENTWPALRGEITTALKEKNLSAAKELLTKLTNLTGPQKTLILQNIELSGMQNTSIEQLVNILNSHAIIAESSIISQVSKILLENNLTWRDLGYTTAIKDVILNKVIIV